MNYQNFLEQLTGRYKDSRKIANNTYLMRIDSNTIGIKLHDTFVVTYKKNGSIILNSGGWKTVTTKARINDFSPVWLTQEKGEWYVNSSYSWSFEGRYIFKDGMQITSKGKVIGAGIDRTKDRQRAINYTNGFMAKLEAKKIPLPDGGDCWSCSMFEKAGMRSEDHIKSHIKEKYFVPSLLMNACKEFGVSSIANDWLLHQMHNYKTKNVNRLHSFEDVAIRQIKSALKRYMLRHIGLPS